jgi:ribosomal-protein-serine acetyltransferase
MMQDYKIDENTYVTLLELKDAEILFELVDNNRDHFGKWLQFAHETKTAADTRQFIARSLHKYADNNGFWTGLWHQGKMVGAIGYLYFDWDDKKTELG